MFHDDFNDIKFHFMTFKRSKFLHTDLAARSFGNISQQSADISVFSYYR